MSFKMKLNIVNKHEYEENEDYREIIVKIPNETEKLERDFRYLGLDYNNLSIQDTHILECEVIDTSDPQFSATISAEISNIIARGNKLGWTAPYQDIKAIFKIINNLNDEDRDKLLAILETKKEDISNIKDAIKFANNIDCFELIVADDEEELARRLIYNGDIDIEDLMDYADLNRLGEDYADDKNMKKTAQGYLTQECDLKNEIRKEEEEEFE
ncbi:MAG TPA: hypothetical protein DCZ30_02260 [Clostridiales bacterium]|nr:hypothetical protein [Clostridiales bacterium]